MAGPPVLELVGAVAGKFKPLSVFGQAESVSEEGGANTCLLRSCQSVCDLAPSGGPSQGGPTRGGGHCGRLVGRRRLLWTSRVSPWLWA